MEEQLQSEKRRAYLELLLKPHNQGLLNIFRHSTEEFLVYIQEMLAELEWRFESRLAQSTKHVLLPKCEPVEQDREGAVAFLAACRQVFNGWNEATYLNPELKAFDGTMIASVVAAVGKVLESTTAENLVRDSIVLDSFIWVEAARSELRKQVEKMERLVAAKRSKSNEPQEKPGPEHYTRSDGKSAYFKVWEFVQKPGNEKKRPAEIARATKVSKNRVPEILSKTRPPNF